MQFSWACKGTVSALVLILVLLLASCGGGNSTTTTVTITISPTAVTLSASQTASFTAIVTGTSNTAVTWSVNGVPGGNDAYGTISASGTYTAPASVTTTATETITATSSADNTKTATASVTLTPSGGTSSTYVNINPVYVVLPAGGQQTFSATVNSAPISVTWKISCNAALPADCGTISSTGAYTAPLSPPPGSGVNLTATAIDGSANPGYGTITIQYSNATLAGQYAFQLSGANGTTPTAAVGSIAFDGSGNINAGGAMDVANGGSSTLSITGGTYHLGTDGRGSAAITTSSGTLNLQLVVDGHSRIFASTADATYGAMAGTLNVQDPTQFDAAAITGTYSFAASSPSATNRTSAFAQVGAFAVDGVSAVSGGLSDINEPGGTHTALAVTGSYTAPAATTGAGTLTLNTSFGAQTFVYYMVDGTAMELLEQSGTRASAGEAVKQVTGPFDATKVKGSFATALYGAGSSAAAGFGAQLVFDGSANVTGTLDSNVGGNVSNGTAVDGPTSTYAVTDPTYGRTTISINNGAYTFVAYPAANQDLYIAEMDTTIAAGPAYTQQAFVVNGASLAGTFATQLTGTSFAGGTAPLAGSGQLTFNGGSAVSGALDLNLNGTLAPNSQITGSYLVGTTGRVSVTLSSPSSLFSAAQMVLYPINKNHFLLFETDSNRVLTANSELQF